MSRRSFIPRWTLSLLMLAALFFGALGGQSLTRVDAAPPENVREPAQEEFSPVLAPDELNIVISEFRTRGPLGGDDEFVELFNPSNVSISIGGWLIRGSNNSGTFSTRHPIPGGTMLAPGQHYLVVGSSYSGATSSDGGATLSSSISDDGGIALTLSDGTTVVDAVGMSSGSAYKEGTILTPLSLTTEQSYERRPGNPLNCTDTNNNAGDFFLNSSSSNPQNMSSAPLACLTITNVTSSVIDDVYLPGAVIDVQVTFSAPVNVVGNPLLLLETGIIDRSAQYASVIGNTLTFNYTVMAGDSSSDLDYFSANAISLNGGSISGAVGDATLILPKPGQPGSLGANKNIVIDNGIAPSTVSFARQTPSTTPTNASSLIFRVTFNEAMVNVDAGDFVVHMNLVPPTTTATVTGLTPVSSNVYDVTVSGGDLATTFNGTVGLDFSVGVAITDAALNALPPTEPSVDETYTVDHIQPSVAVNQHISQADPTGAQPVLFTVVFSEPINVVSFTSADITQGGSAPFTTWSIIDTGDHQTFTLSGTSTGNGTFIPSIAANRVTDPAGNNNTLSTSLDNSVTLNDVTPPSVTINQNIAQVDPTVVLPITFTVVFSEPINIATFNTSDITQTGTATGVSWSLANSGNNKTFTLSAIASGYGTLVPTIGINRVNDLVGLSNSASTSTDNSVTYNIAPTNTPTPTVTRTITPTGISSKTIVITEVAWMGTAASADDEWIELLNTTTAPVNLAGWQIRTFRSQSGDNIFAVIQLSGIIQPGEFFLAERGDDNTVKGIDADLIYPLSVTFGGTSHSTQLSNSGELLLLCSPNNISSGDCRPSHVSLATTVGDLVNAETFTNRTPSASNPWPAGSTSTLGSMERKNLISNEDTNWYTHTGAKPQCGHDANWNGISEGSNQIKGTPKCANWAFNVTATPRPTNTPTRTATPFAIPGPVLVLNEFVVRPGHDWNNDGQVNTLDEFVEVINAGQVPVTLSQYKLDDYEEDINGVPINNGFTLPSRTLQPGEIAVFYASDTGFFLSDAGDTVRLVKASNYTIVDSLTYPAVLSLDMSYCRYTDGYGSWLNRCFPTPGLPNSLTGGSFPPEPGGAISNICLLPDNAPVEFVMAECEQSGLDIWNPEYWDSFPGEGDELWLYELWYKWLEIFQ